MKSNTIAVMGYPDKLNKYRLSTNRQASVQLINNQIQGKQKP
jgi:hypothetical protein